MIWIFFQSGPTEGFRRPCRGIAVANVVPMSPKRGFLTPSEVVLASGEISAHTKRRRITVTEDQCSAEITQ
ncbi:hypothetical protein U1Q18_021652 [Sarracenia purpurea var. burkii]